MHFLLKKFTHFYYFFCSPSPLQTWVQKVRNICSFFGCCIPTFFLLFFSMTIYYCFSSVKLFCFLSHAQKRGPSSLMSSSKMYEDFAPKISTKNAKKRRSLLFISFFCFNLSKKCVNVKEKWFIFLKSLVPLQDAKCQPLLHPRLRRMRFK